MSFHVLTLGPVDAISYYAACESCNYCSAPFDSPQRARAAGERHVWARHDDDIVRRSA